MIQIAPSLLAADSKIINFSKLEKALKKSNNADLYHIDVMDGKFVSQETEFLDPDWTLRIKMDVGKDLDVHLMTANPENYVDEFAKAGADMISFHIEAVDNKRQFNSIIKKIKNNNKKVGAALNPDTNIDVLLDYCDNNLNKLDFVLLMSVVPGKCGQNYLHRVTNKIRELRKIINEKNYSTLIEVDGGIKKENAYMPINAGAHIIVSGSGIYDERKENNNKTDYNKIIREMRNAVLIGSDHGGLNLKERIKKYLHNKKIAFYDIGTYTPEPCDYPEIAGKMADYVNHIESGEYRRGILCCGTGIGMSITANRFQNVRAAVCYNTFTAKMSREHNDANILCLGERSLGEGKAINILKTFLETKFSNEKRHIRRINKINKAFF